MDETKKELQPIAASLPETDELDFFKSVCDLIQEARSSLEKSVNTVMVVTHYEIGRRIIEKEQLGEKRAQYGKQILQGLSDFLTAELGGGFSIDNLRLMRKFYSVYSAFKIQESLIPEFNPNISWTHYIQLMRIPNEDERRFYELEIADNGWTIKEFQRQFDTSRYERLALSRDKEKVRELPEENNQIFAARYQTVLPSKEQLKKALEIEDE